jgi:hypothetical protein
LIRCLDDKAHDLTLVKTYDSAHREVVDPVGRHLIEVNLLDREFLSMRIAGNVLDVGNERVRTDDIIARRKTVCGLAEISGIHRRWIAGGVAVTSGGTGWIIHDFAIRPPVDKILGKFVDDLIISPIGIAAHMPRYCPRQPTPTRYSLSDFLGDKSLRKTDCK